jgi:hypothetical protein
MIFMAAALPRLFQSRDSTIISHHVLIDLRNLVGFTGTKDGPRIITITMQQILEHGFKKIQLK